MAAMTACSALDRRIQSYLRAQILDIGDCERTACFIASFDVHSNNRYLNYALPEDGAKPDESAIGSGEAASHIQAALRGHKPGLNCC
jgi:hypothetical protein